MTKLLLSILTMMVMSMHATAQESQETFHVGRLYYQATSATTAKVVRPEMIPPKKALPISYYFDEYLVPGSVQAPDGRQLTVTCIGEGAFHVNQGQGQYRVVLPATVREIEKEAFFSTSVTDIVLNDGLEVIGEEAFSRSELKRLSIPGSVRTMGKGILTESKIEELNVLDGVRQLPEEMCYRAQSLRSVTLGNSILEIGESAFRECPELSVFRWPSQLTTIAPYTFSESGMNNGHLPGRLQHIGDFAFWGAQLTDVSIPASLKSFGEGAFDCTTITSFTVASGSATYASHEGLLMNKGKTAIVCAPLGQTGHVHLPSTLREVGEWAFLNSTVEEVTIPPSVKVLHKGAFEQCERLHTVHFSEGLERIEREAFRKCSSLDHVLLPASLRQLEGSAFVFCNSLHDFRIHPSNRHFAVADGDLYDAQKTTLIKVADGKQGAYAVANGVTAIGPYAFASCEHITSVTMPQCVRHIGKGAFIHCKAISDINLPDQIEEIGDWAFSGCEKMVRYSLPSSLKKIGAYAFDANASLTEMTIPEGVTELPDGLWRDCRQLHVVQLPDGLTRMGGLVFQKCTSIERVVLPSKIQSIGNSAFAECPSLRHLTLPSSLRAIPGGMVRDCKQLTELVLPERLDSILENGLAHSGLTSLTIPASVRHIGRFAFSQCEQLCALVLPSGLSEICDGTFNHCKSLASVALPKGIRKIGDYAFSYCESLEAIVVPEGVDTLGKRSFEFCTALHVIDLPSTLKQIGSSAFENCYNLRRAVLPEGLVTLGSSAYQGAGLQQLVLPPTLLAIPFAAFRNNYELTDVQFNGQTTLGKSYTFSNCTHLKTLSLPATMQSIGDYAFESCTRLEDVRLNEGLTEILDNAFIKCRSLRQLTLPSSVQGLYKSPFEQCDSLMHLTSLAVAPPYCLGTAASGYAHYNPFGSSRVPRTVSVPYISEGVYKQTYGWDQHNIVTHPDLPKNVYINQDYNLTWPADLMASWKPNIHLTPTAKNVQSYYDYVTIGSLYVGSKASLSADTLTTYYGFHVAKEADNRRFFTPMLVNGTARADIIVTEMNVPQDFWTFFSLPYDVKVADITRSHPDDPFVIRTYDGQKRAEGKNTEAWVNMTADSTLHAGQGYIIRTANGDYYQHYNNFFLPSVNNGNKTRYFTNADVVIDLKEYPTEFAHNRSWNFLGNPYPCFFDIRAMQTTSPVTVWSRSGRYETYSPLDDDFILNPGQAFFVQRPLEQSQLIFLKEGRQQNLTIRDTIYYNSSRARMAGQQRQVFNLLLFDGGNPSAQADRTRLVVNEAASRSYEPGLDASKFFSIEAGAAHLYTLCDGVQYAINERPLADGLVQLGLQVSREGTYTISLAQQLLSLVGEGPGLRSVTLIDQQEHTETDLTTQDYTFQAASGTSNQRFLIRLDGSTSGITETTAGKPVNSTYYDLQGRPVSQPQQGIYVKDGQKVIIK